MSCDNSKLDCNLKIWPSLQVLIELDPSDPKKLDSDSNVHRKHNLLQQEQ